MTYKKIRAGSGRIEALEMKLLEKKLIVMRGNKGYIMCGYLNLKAAEKFGDAAIKITGVSTISEALHSSVSACTSGARKLGVFKGQAVKDCLRLIV